jgi:hypothetical protein
VKKPERVADVGIVQACQPTSLAAGEMLHIPAQHFHEQKFGQTAQHGAISGPGRGRFTDHIVQCPLPPEGCVGRDRRRHGGSPIAANGFKRDGTRLLPDAKNNRQRIKKWIEALVGGEITTDDLRPKSAAAVLD